MKTLLVLLSIGLLISVNASAGICRSNPNCASGQECYDSQIGEMVCKDSKQDYETIVTCESTSTTQTKFTIELQQAVDSTQFDRVVVNHGLPRAFIIAQGFPALSQTIFAVTPQRGLRLQPLGGNQAELKIGDRQLNKATSHNMICKQVQ